MESSQNTTSHEPSRDRLAKITSCPFLRGSDNQAHLSAPNYVLTTVNVSRLCLEGSGPGGIGSRVSDQGCLEAEGSGGKHVSYECLLGLRVYLKYTLYNSSRRIMSTVKIHQSYHTYIPDIYIGGWSYITLKTCVPRCVKWLNRV